MKISFHIKDIIIGNKQKNLIEKKLTGLKKYLEHEPVKVDVYMKDETSQEKGGIDQAIEINLTYGGDKIFVREVDDKMMRAFAYAYKSVERQLIREHKKRTDKERGHGIKNIWKGWGKKAE